MVAKLPESNEALTYDDVLLVPGYSDITSRHDVSLTHGRLKLDTPFISSNMDTITEENMAIAMHQQGGMGIVHRFLNPRRLEQIIKRCKANGVNVCVSVGINDDSDDLLHMAIKNRVKLYCVDVAHGHHAGVAARIEDIRRLTLGWLGVKIIAGNVATLSGAKFLADAGANIIKVGIGPGSHCTTRIVTGHGVPQLTAISDIYWGLRRLLNTKLYKHKIEIIADGGIRNSGDIAKAIAVGANYVMLGRLLAGCAETPMDTFLKDGKRYKIYRGMASFSAQKDRGRSSKRIISEGVKSMVPETGSVEVVINELRGGLASACSYTGARTIGGFKKKARLIKVTSSSYLEGTPHGT
jgi:IMP dehydrogenase